MRPVIGYIFIDESGNWVFSKKGTQYLVFTSLFVKDPHIFDNRLSNLRYDFLKNGHDISEFHATEDKQFVRDKVIKCLKEERGNLEIDAIVIEKCKANPTLSQNKGRLYKKVFLMLLRYVLYRQKFDKLLIFTDTLPDITKKEEFKKGLKVAVKLIIPNKSFHVYHHPSNSHYCLQAVDYFGWTIYKKHGDWGVKDDRSYNELRHRIRSVFDLFALSDGTTYY